MINLLPPSIKKEAKLASLQTEVIRSSILLFLAIMISTAVLVAGLVRMSQQNNDLKDTIQNKEFELEVINKTQEAAILLGTDIETVGLLLDRRIDFAKLIQDIGAVLPNGSTLFNLALDTNNSESIELLFTTDSQLTAAILRQNLEDSGVFTGAEIQNITANNGNGQKDTVFYSTTVRTKFSDKYLDDQDSFNTGAALEAVTEVEPTEADDTSIEADDTSTEADDTSTEADDTSIEADDTSIEDGDTNEN